MRLTVENPPIRAIKDLLELFAIKSELFNSADLGPAPCDGRTFEGTRQPETSAGVSQAGGVRWQV